jgi:hypothetical protein
MAMHKDKSIIRVADSSGRLIHNNGGSWNDEQEINAKAEEIFAACENRGDSDQKKTLSPEYSERSIAAYEFFRKNIYNPARIFYPCCFLDASPFKGFPNSQIVLMDRDEVANKAMVESGIEGFVRGDVLKYSPKKPFDLVIILSPNLPSKDLTRHLVRGGYVISNNYHNNASQLRDDPLFEGIGTIDLNENGIYLAKGDFSKLEPEQYENYSYIFRKIKGRK